VSVAGLCAIKQIKLIEKLIFITRLRRKFHANNATTKSRKLRKNNNRKRRKKLFLMASDAMRLKNRIRRREGKIEKKEATGAFGTCCPEFNDLTFKKKKMQKSLKKRIIDRRKRS
jgi:hypothetical protein